jgi:hypothetical protein
MERPGILGVSSENLHEEKARKDAYDSALFWLDIGRAEFASDGLFRGYSQKLVDKSCCSVLMILTWPGEGIKKPGNHHPRRRLLRGLGVRPQSDKK